MPCLVITTKQLEREFSDVFADGRYMPSKCWVEHFHADATYLRAVYDRSFPVRGVERMELLRRRIVKKFGPKADVVVVLMLDDADWDWFAAHRLLIHAAR